MSNQTSLPSSAAAAEFAAAQNKLLGYPRQGVPVRTDATTLAALARDPTFGSVDGYAAPEKHPTREEYAVAVAPETETKALDTEETRYLSAAEKATLIAGVATATERDKNDWKRTEPRTAGEPTRIR